MREREGWAGNENIQICGAGGILQTYDWKRSLWRSGELPPLFVVFWKWKSSNSMKTQLTFQPWSLESQLNDTEDHHTRYGLNGNITQNNFLTCSTFKKLHLLSLCEALRMEFKKVMPLNEFQLLLGLYLKDLVSFRLMWGSNWGRCLMRRTSQFDKSSTTLRLGSYRRCHPVRAGKPFSGTAGRCLTRLLVSEWKFCLSAQHQSRDWTEWWKAGQPVWKC